MRATKIVEEAIIGTLPCSAIAREYSKIYCLISHKLLHLRKSYFRHGK